MPKSAVNWKILALTVFLILAILLATYAIGYAIDQLLRFVGLLSSIDLPIELRLAGIILMAAGLITGLAVMTVRRPLDILVSTSDTFMKLLRRKPISQTFQRTEPFVPKGPYRFVRNPMYFTLLSFIFGIGLVNSSVTTLLWGVAQTCWFIFYEIPFEEKELQVLFGESYERYKHQVPMLVPYGKKYKPDTNPS